MHNTDTTPIQALKNIQWMFLAKGPAGEVANKS
jgi:hypothetical protein